MHPADPELGKQFKIMNMGYAVGLSTGDQSQVYLIHFWRCSPRIRDSCIRGTGDQSQLNQHTRLL